VSYYHPGFAITPYRLKYEGTFMNKNKRIFNTLLAGILTLLFGVNAFAQAWPTRSTIRIVVPYPPGGASDVTARLLAMKLTDSLKQSVVVENKPGANGILALESVAKSPADGYTLLMANLGPNAINAGVYQKLPYDSIKDFTPITLTSVVPLVILVTNSMPVKTMPELIAYAKANPTKLSFASAGNGAANHLAGEMIKSMAGIQMTHIPYKGDSPGMPDVISGTVSMMFPTIIAGMPNIKSGSMRPIAVTGAKRSSSLPDIPTVSESGIPGFEAVSWGGVMGPAGMPADIVKRLNTEIIRILKLPDISEKMTSLGADIVGSSPEEFDKYLRAEISKWGKVARENNIRLD
jgi:tripartite-type tricarboxylate transporter receptor subunit TctC